MSQVLSRGTEEDLTERLVNRLAEMEERPDGATAAALSRELDLSRYAVLRELHALELIGLVVRTGTKRGTRWWLA